MNNGRPLEIHQKLDATNVGSKIYSGSSHLHMSSKSAATTSLHTEDDLGISVKSGRRGWNLRRILPLVALQSTVAGYLTYKRTIQTRQVSVALPRR